MISVTLRRLPLVSSMASLIRSMDEIDIRGPQLARNPDLILHYEVSQESNRFTACFKKVSKN